MNTSDPEQPLLPGMPERQTPADKSAAKSNAKSTRRPIGGAGLIPADDCPVARICVDVTPLHLDRPFDYLVPETMSEGAQPGTRVKVRFGAQDVDGIILERAQTSEHTGKLSPIRRLVSSEVVLSEPVAELARAVADYYGGGLWDVLRLAIPPRHARIETAPSPQPVPDASVQDASKTDAAAETSTAQSAAPTQSADPVPSQGSAPRPESAWSAYSGGEAFVKRMQAGDGPRAVWTALPGDWTPTGDNSAGDGKASSTVPLAQRGWELALAQAVVAARDAGRGALVVLPDLRDVNRLTAALQQYALKPYGRTGGDFARLLAEDGPAPRYRSYLAVLRGEVRIAIGTRAAAFAPVHDLGLVVCWEDGEQTLTEQRAPYPHAREVLALRSELENCAFLIGSVSRSAEAQALLHAGWAREITMPRPDIRRRTPRVRVLDSVELASEGPAAAARIPNPAWRALRTALADGPVLVQVPRRGYVPVIACQQCREPARCSNCHGPLGLTTASSAPQCTWCGQLAADWHCTECNGTKIRSVRVGSERTAEELGRAFPGIPVRVSGASSAGGVLDQVTGTPALIVATPGAEPIAAGGYSAALFLDATVMSSGTSLDSGHQALLRWLAAASLVRDSSRGGTVIIVGDAVPAVVNSVVRWDPAGFADRDLVERTELALPPVVRVGAVTGDRAGVDAILQHLEVEPDWRVLGPVDVADTDDTARAIVSAPRARGRALALALRAAAATRSMKREGARGHIELDPAELL